MNLTKFSKYCNWPFLMAIIFLGIWLILSMQLNTSLYMDNLEQFIWAHGTELGYWKHPPLTTWLIIGFQYLFGFHIFNTYILSFLCLSITLFFFWKLANLLFPSNIADLALLLLSSSYMLTWRAQLFNHNVGLVLTTTINVWLFIYLVQKPKVENWQWCLLGFFSALAMLAKYQAAVSLAGLFLVFFLMRKNHNKQVVNGLVLAFIVFVLTLIPHLVWIYQSDFIIAKSTFHYFNNDISWFKRTKNLVSFMVQQIRYFLVPILILLCLFINNRRNKTRIERSTIDLNSSLIIPCFYGLILFPFLVVVFLNQVSGLALSNHWGFGIFLYLPLLLAWWASNFLVVNKSTFLWLYVIFQLIGLGVFFSVKEHQRHSIMTRQVDVFYPSDKITAAIKSTWQSETNCPIKYINGPLFESGIVSVYSGDYPAVLEQGDMKKSPWIKQSSMDESGQIIISHDLSSLKGLGKVYQLPNAIQKQFLPLHDFYWTIIPPKKACD
jgi:4-amino-4-deoxy-L-arabinose transferase-like glycosyltransferase